MKCAAWVDDDGDPQVCSLDIGGSLGATLACAEAIEKSLRKLSLLGRKI